MCRYNRFLSCSSKTSTKYYFPHRTLFHFISPRHPATGRQSCLVACLLVSGVDRGGMESKPTKGRVSTWISFSTAGEVPACSRYCGAGTGFVRLYNPGEYPAGPAWRHGGGRLGGLQGGQRSGLHPPATRPARHHGEPVALKGKIHEIDILLSV
jgi:hypothetical protein